MKPIQNAGFTLIELLIVVSIISVLTGVFSKFWFGMEKMEKASSFRATSVMRGKDVIDRIARDVRQAWNVEIVNDGELVIQQLNAEGRSKSIRYFFEEGELMREFQNRNDETTIHKIATLSPEVMRISMEESAVFRLEIDLPARDQPLYRRGGKLVSLIRVEGGL